MFENIGSAGLAVPVPAQYCGEGEEAEPHREDRSACTAEYCLKGGKGKLGSREIRYAL